MQIDIDFYLGKKIGGPTEPTAGIIRIFGVNRTNNSIMVHVHDFLPYFYVQCPKQFILNEKNIIQLKTEINQFCHTLKRINKQEAISRIDAMKKESLKNFKGVGDRSSIFFKIVVH